MVDLEKQVLLFLFFRYEVIGKDVYAHTHIGKAMKIGHEAGKIEILFVCDDPRLLHIVCGPETPVFSIYAREHKALRKLRCRQFKEPVIIIPQHIDINIIIPGDEALVPYRAKEGACCSVPGDIVFFAESAYYLKYFKFCGPGPLHH